MSDEVLLDDIKDYWEMVERKQKRAEDFLQNPSRESFAKLVDKKHFWATRARGSIDHYLDKFVFAEDQTPELVAETIETALQTGAVKPLTELGGLGWATGTEILRALDPDQFAILNTRSKKGLEALGYSAPNKNSASQSQYEDFVADVRDASAQFDLKTLVEEVTGEPIPEWATDLEIADFAFSLHHDGNTDLTDIGPGPKPNITLEEIGQENADYYWVNQHNHAEIENEYLRAKTDGLWHHDLNNLAFGDVVFHNFDNELVGISRVTETAETYTMQDEEYYRVHVDMYTFSEPVPVDDALKQKLGRDDLRTEKYYPVDKNNNLNEAYLANLSRSAAEFLLEQADIEEIPDWPDNDANFFWISANPSIWKVESIEDGGDVFYTAINQKGNKRRIYGAFEKASPGDKVIFYESHPVKAIVAEGRIVKGLHVEEEEGYDEPVEGITIEYSRPIDEISWDQLSAVPDLETASPITNRAQGSLFELTGEQYDTILALEEPDESIRSDQFEVLRKKIEPINIDFEIPDTLYFENAPELKREIEASLNSGKHIIFTGPPGTGKTKLAKEISRQAVTDLPQVDGHTFTTATSEWTAFDTIGGYVPVTNTAETEDELRFQPRLFLNSFRSDKDGIINDWLVIDEINRSDIDKAFGQLFSVLSGDSVELPYERQNPVEIVSVSRDASKEELQAIATNPDVFPVTPSWRLLATMNTYDKASLYEMSYAFMRRFNFIHVGVPALRIDDEVRTSLLDPDRDDNYATAWVAKDEELRPILQDFHREVAVLWERINAERVIGPSIVHDILQYLAAYDDITGTRSAALTSAVISLVYPQLEGLRPERQKRLIRSLVATDVETQDGTVTLNLNDERLQDKAADFFGISFDDDS